MITKDKTNLPIIAITPENYVVPKGEERFYHVKMEVKTFDQHTGERLSHPFIQKFTRVDFEGGMMSILRQQGYDMIILHNPKEWAAKQAAESSKAKAQKEAEAKAAEEERFKAAVAAEVAKQVAALKKEEAKPEDEKKASGSKKKKEEAKPAEAEAPVEEAKPAEAEAPSDEEPDLS